MPLQHACEYITQQLHAYHQMLDLSKNLKQLHVIFSVLRQDVINGRRQTEVHRRTHDSLTS